MAKDVRLQKVLAEQGVASRRKSEELIAAGEVTVNGAAARLGEKVDPKRDRICVRGKPLAFGRREITVMLYKPRGIVTTMKDEKGRNCVAGLVTDIPERVYPVGRLDRESEGLLLMTNDGEFANAMTHPSHHVPKNYRVTVRPRVTEDQLASLSAGMMIDGRMTAPAQVRVLVREEGRTVLEIVLREGRNRQIRKMCEQLGLEVARLKRTAVGTLRLGMLRPGKWRELSGDELRRLKNAACAETAGHERNRK